MTDKGRETDAFVSPSSSACILTHPEVPLLAPCTEGRGCEDNGEVEEIIKASIVVVARAQRRGGGGRGSMPVARESHVQFSENYGRTLSVWSCKVVGEWWGVRVLLFNCLLPKIRAKLTIIFVHFGIL